MTQKRGQGGEVGAVSQHRDGHPPPEEQAGQEVAQEQQPAELRPIGPPGVGVGYQGCTYCMENSRDNACGSNGISYRNWDRHNREWKGLDKGQGLPGVAPCDEVAAEELRQGP